MNRILVGTLLSMSATIVACQAPPDSPIATQPPSSPVASSPAERETAGFNEAVYLLANPDVKKMVAQGKYKTGLEHYTKVGQTAKNPEGEHYGSFFTGTNGNDTVQGMGKGEHCHFAGVGFEVVADKKGEFPVRPKSLGQGQTDVLVGNKGGGNEFILGSFITPANPKAESFYVGKGDADYARIRNFTRSKDSIMLAGEPSQYKIVPKDGNTRISTAKGDLIAIVEGVTQLKVGEISKEYGVFGLK